MSRESELMRVPPQDIEAEASSLGSMLLEPACIDEVEAIIPRGKGRGIFYRPDHDTLYAALVDMRANDQVIDIITLEDYLKAKGELEEIGGRDYLIDLVNSVPSAANVVHYAKIVLGKSRKRDVIRLGHALMQHGYEAEWDADTVLEKAEAEAMRIRGSLPGLEPRRASDVGKTVVKQILSGEEEPGLSTGFPTLDDRLQGMRPGQMIVLAARPATGKTALVLQIADHVADALDVPVLFFSMEMKSESLIRRMISRRLEIPGQYLRRPDRLGDYQRSEMHRLQLPANLHLVDATDLTPGDLRSRSRRMKQAEGVGLVVVDYLGLIGDEQVEQNKAVAVAKISRAMKAMALELDVPVILLHSLSRSSQHEQRPPDLHDLRDSGAIEHDADVVLMLHPAKKPDPNQKQPPAREMFLLIRKNREGSTASVRMAFHGGHQKFTDVRAIGSRALFDDGNGDEAAIATSRAKTAEEEEAAHTPF